MSQDHSDEESAVAKPEDSPVAPPPPQSAPEPTPVKDAGGDVNSAQQSPESEIDPAPIPPQTAWSPDQGEAPSGELEADPPQAFEPDPPSIQPAAMRASLGTGSNAAAQPEAEEFDDELDEVDEEYEPRRIHLSIAKIDTWSTLKLSFLLSVAIGIGIIVATACVWLMLDGMAVFTKIDDLLQSVAGDEAQIEILQYFEFNKVVSLATIVAVVDVIVITLIATLGSVIYNLVSSLIGGLKITLTDE